MSLYTKLHKLLAGLVKRLYRVRVIGAENEPENAPFIVCANHISVQDVLILAACLKHPMRFLAKAELFRIPVIRGICRAFGAVPVERTRGDVGAIRRSIEVAKSGEILAVFPQGTRQKGKNPADTPIKPGSAMIAARAGVPILPVCIRIKKERYAFLRRVDIIIGQPLSLDTLGLLGDEPNFREAADAAFSAVCELGGYRPSALPESV